MYYIYIYSIFNKHILCIIYVLYTILHCIMFYQVKFYDIRYDYIYLNLPLVHKNVYHFFLPDFKKCARLRV